MSEPRTLHDAVMQDPLVVAWRAFSDRFMDSAYRDDPGRFHIRDAFAAGWDAAIKAEAGRSADSLDVERLEQAMHIVDDEVQFMHRDAAQHRDVMAKRIAREYARLTTDEPEGDGR